MNEETLGERAARKLQVLFLLDDNEVNYIKKLWEYNEAAQSTSMSLSMSEHVAEAREKVYDHRLEYLIDIVTTYSFMCCPKCESILLFNADIDAMYWCEVCSVGVNYLLEIVEKTDG